LFSPLDFVGKDDVQVSKRSFGISIASPIDRLSFSSSQQKETMSSSINISILDSKSHQNYQQALKQLDEN